MKVVVGMSGGVDSAVAAYLLLQKGYEVEAVYMKNWDSNLNNDFEGITDGICSQEQDYIDAQKVCEKLQIKLYRVDFIKEYWDYVFSYFLNELKEGRTPNPDIMCNKYIKFDKFLNFAYSIGADKVATGHYAKFENNFLLKGLDNNKDQSYFLSQVPLSQFKDILFPVGNLTKTEVREIAKKALIPVSDKKDSTGICFIGERNFQKFIQNYLKKSKGNIINIETNEIIGTHEGLMNYTIGQRKNVGLSGDAHKHFVVGKDTSKNILYVAFEKADEYLISDSCIIENINYLSEERPLKAKAKFRYRQEDVDVNLEYISNNNIKVIYTGVKSVTPGQACVIYLNNKVILGSTIKEVYKNNEKIWYL